MTDSKPPTTVRKHDFPSISSAIVSLIMPSYPARTLSNQLSATISPRRRRFSTAAILHPSTPALSGACLILNLPVELQLLILEHLDFADFERLRRTCRSYHAFITKSVISQFFSPAELRTTLLSHCYLCLRHDPSRKALLCPDRSDPRYPLASRCIDCASRRDEFAVGKRFALGNLTSAWICRWCGFPVPSDEAAIHVANFHRACHRKFNFCVVGWFFTGMLQAIFTLIASALCWHDYGQPHHIITGLSILAVGLSVPCFMVSLYRRSFIRTYHTSAILEAMVLGTWAALLYLVIREQLLAPASDAVHIGAAAFRTILVLLSILL